MEFFQSFLIPCQALGRQLEGLCFDVHEDAAERAQAAGKNPRLGAFSRSMKNRVIHGAICLSKMRRSEIGRRRQPPARKAGHDLDRMPA